MDRGSVFSGHPYEPHLGNTKSFRGINEPHLGNEKPITGTSNQQDPEICLLKLLAIERKNLIFTQ